jgi:hypothetical protein
MSKQKQEILKKLQLRKNKKDGLSEIVNTEEDLRPSLNIE